MYNVTRFRYTISFDARKIIANWEILKAKYVGCRVPKCTSLNGQPDTFVNSENLKIRQFPDFTAQTWLNHPIIRYSCRNDSHETIIKGQSKVWGFFFLAKSSRPFYGLSSFYDSPGIRFEWSDERGESLVFYIGINGRDRVLFFEIFSI